MAPMSPQGVGVLACTALADSKQALDLRQAAVLPFMFIVCVCDMWLSSP